MPSVTVQPTSAASAITPYTGGTNRSTFTAWTSASNAQTEDGTNTTSNSSTGTRWLVATDFKSSGVALATTIAAGATISSITGRYKRQKTTGAGNITEAALVLRTSGAGGGAKSNDMNDGSTWPGSLTDRTFTATFSGTTADVRDSTFGVALAANHSTTATAGVDIVELTISYLNPPVLTPTGSSLAYTENDAATAVDSGITVTADVTNLTGATAQITTGFAAEDTLAFSNQNGITGSWDSGTGTMTMSGTATVAQYQTALRSITYVNSSSNPSTTTRVVTFTATDGTRSATSVTRSITIAAIDDASAPTPSFIEWSMGIAGAAVPRGDGVLMAHIASSDGGEYVVMDTGPVQVLTAPINMASFSGAADLVAAIPGKAIAVLSITLQAGSDTAAYFLDTTGQALFGGAAGTVQLLANAGFSLEFNRHAWMRSGVGSALRINLGTAATLGGAVQYVLI